MEKKINNDLAMVASHMHDMMSVWERHAHICIITRYQIDLYQTQHNESIDSCAWFYSTRSASSTQPGLQSCEHRLIY